MNSLVRLTAELDADPSTVGGKAAGLAALLRAGATTPPTWVVPAGARVAARELHRLSEIAPRWAVRSSATVEDGTALSYAGMFATELDVPVAELPAAIARVRASSRGDRLVAYRSRIGARSREIGAAIGMAVVLQPFRRPLHSGVWMGRGLDRGRLEWLSGSGERLVSGVATPHWEEWTRDGQAGGVAEPLAHGRDAVGRDCLALQGALGVPADFEFAILDTGLVWLQFRPVTATPLSVHSEQPAGAETAVVRGTPASPGQVSARGLWMRDVTDPRWEPGTVLLTERTDPDWVPLMVEAASLVTVEGGMLCHAAIIARELGMPCITGVGAAAMARLASGGTLTVDGTAGTVSMEAVPG